MIANDGCCRDLLTGVVTNRDLSEYTVVGNLLVWIRIARCLHDVFQHIDQNKNPSYPFLLDQDTRLQDVSLPYCCF